MLATALDGGAAVPIEAVGRALDVVWARLDRTDGDAIEDPVVSRALRRSEVMCGQLDRVNQAAQHTEPHVFARWVWLVANSEVDLLKGERADEPDEVEVAEAAQQMLARRVRGDARMRELLRALEVGSERSPFR